MESIGWLLFISCFLFCVAGFCIGLMVGYVKGVKHCCNEIDKRREEILKSVK